MWTRLNRRYLPDFYAPVTGDSSFGHLAIGLDASGSVWDLAPEFLAEVNGILKQLRPIKTTVLPFDTEIKGEPLVFHAGEEVNQGTTIYGGGGTSFVPVFDWVKDNPCDAVIMLTDMMGTFPDHAPACPVIWVSTEEKSAPPPFGTITHLPARE